MLRNIRTKAELITFFQVYGAGSEDMDTLTFNAPILLRHLTFSEAKKAPISEINLKTVLEELEMDMERVSISAQTTVHVLIQPQVH